MRRPSVAWVLNLDAEHELEARGPWTPDARLRAIVEREARRLAGTLVEAGDVVVREEDVLAARRSGRPHPAAGLPGLAWSPTPRALALLERAGARPVAAPPRELLRSVNARPFAAGARAALGAQEGGSFPKRVTASLEETLEALALPAPQGWLVRRTFGAAGRGRRRIASLGGAGSARALEPAEAAWLRASLRLGPLVVEPWVTLTREHTRAGWVEEGGAVLVSAPCFQGTTAQGAWVASEPAAPGALSPADDARLAEALEHAGRALATAGYRGPFGIDAFHHRAPGAGPGSPEVLNPLSEINARFTMDWTAGMGARGRRSLDGLAGERETSSSLVRCSSRFT